MRSPFNEGLTKMEAVKMKVGHPGFEFMAQDLAEALPEADPDVIRSACIRVDDVCYLVVEVPSAEVISAALLLFAELQAVSATPEERAVFGTAADWAQEMLSGFIYAESTT